MLDPACGTGGFLITAMNHVLGKIEEVHGAVEQPTEIPRKRSSKNFIAPARNTLPSE